MIPPSPLEKSEFGVGESLGSGESQGASLSLKLNNGKAPPRMERLHKLTPFVKARRKPRIFPMFIF